MHAPCQRVVFVSVDMARMLRASIGGDGVNIRIVRLGSFVNVPVCYAFVAVMRGSGGAVLAGFMVAHQRLKARDAA